MNNDDDVEVKQTFFNRGFPQHLYVHWPFCKNKCHYCDFVALEKHERFQEEYHVALRQEMSSFFKQFSLNGINKPSIKTLFLGGGTPSLYPLTLLKETFTFLHAHLSFNADQETTIEVNPGGLTDEHFKTWRECGINRLSLGVQVLDDEVLKKLNRMLTEAEVQEFMNKAPAFFNNISVDLILGLPGVTQEVWEYTLTQAVSWPITHISVYFLTIHENTPLAHGVKRGKITVSTDDALVDGYLQVVDFLEQHGFEQYEVSNFARPGYQSIHNQAYWDRKAYKGFGLGAASFDGEHRLVNEKNLSRYTAFYNEGKRGCASTRSGPTVERVSSQQAHLETIMLGLRQKKGIPLQDMIYYLPSGKKVAFLEKLEKLKERNCIEEKEKRVCLTKKGMALENEVVLYLV